MGLDMNAFATKAKPATEVDFSTKNFEETELHYWRKHPNLHGWMESLYYEKGGVPVVLDNEDLDVLEEDIKSGNLPDTAGFFFGQSDGDEVDGDLEFIAKAREAIKNGMTVYYTSWW
jgi:hypothetical protein